GPRRLPPPTLFPYTTLFRSMTSQDDDYEVRVPFEQGRADFRAGAVGELEVQEHDVRGVVRCSAERLGTARCLDDVECAVSGKLRADSLSDELLTLDDEDSRGHCVSLGCTRSPPLPALATSTRPS